MTSRTPRMSSALLRGCLAAAVLGCATQAGAATIFSQNFSSELANGSDPSTNYTLINTGVFSLPSQYRVISNPHDDFTNNYQSYTDHTGSSPSAMLFFDGQQGLTIWSTSTQLVAGTAYQFSFYGSSGSNVNVPVIQASLDGDFIGTALTTSAGTWTQFTYDFVAASSGLSTFKLFDLIADGNGNDGAIDDIALVTRDVITPPNRVPEPGVLGLLGLGLLAAVVRRRAVR